jgi:hypothetical protein
MVAIPTTKDEDAKRPNRERQSLVGEQTRIVNRMKASLIRRYRATGAATLSPFRGVSLSVPLGTRRNSLGTNSISSTTSNSLDVPSIHVVIHVVQLAAHVYSGSNADSEGTSGVGAKPSFTRKQHFVNDQE